MIDLRVRGRAWCRRGVIFFFAALFFHCSPAPSTSHKTKLVLATHWTDYQRAAINRYLAEYMQLHPDIEIEHQNVPFEDYFKKVQISHLSGEAPDIYNVYSLWGVQLVNSGVLDPPPAEVVNDITQNYIAAAIKGVTINGEIWGIPGELDNYCLVYNKKILKEIGAVDEHGEARPPATWEELIDIAKRATTFDSEGNILRYGYAFLVGWDSAVVHPFLALLYSNGGQFLSDDGKQCAFNGPQGVAALQAELRLFHEKATDTRGSVWEFPNQRVAMMTMATWYESELKLLLGDKYDEVVGVAPIPRLGNDSATVLYTWFMCVDSRSKHKKQAWDFLMWLTAELQPEKQTTRLGDFFCETLNALPGRKIDIENHQAELNDLYTSAFVKELEHSITEPNLDQGQEIKMILMNAIVDAWHGKRGAQEALDLAARKINYILREFSFYSE